MERFTKGDIARIVIDEQRAPSFDEAKAIWAYINRTDRAGRDTAAERNRLREDLGKANSRIVGMLETRELAEDVVDKANDLLEGLVGDDPYVTEEVEQLRAAVDRWDGAK